MTAHFIVNLNGNILRVTEVSGLNIFIESLETRDGLSKETNPLKTPGSTRYDNIILKRVLTVGGNEFYNLLLSTRIEKQPEVDLSISLLNKEHEPTITWHCRNVFPVRYSSPVLNANTNAVAIEELELAVEVITISFGS